MAFLGRFPPPWLRALRILPVALTLENETSKRKLPMKTTTTLSPRLSTSGYELAAKASSDGSFLRPSVPVLDDTDITRGSVTLSSVEDGSYDNDSSKKTDAGQIQYSIDVIDDFIFKSFDSVDDLNEKTRQEEGLRDVKRDSKPDLKQTRFDDISGLASVQKDCVVSMDSDFGMKQESRVSAGPSMDCNVHQKVPYDNLYGEERKTKRRKKDKVIAEKPKGAVRHKPPVTYFIDDKDPDWVPRGKKKTQMKRKLNNDSDREQAGKRTKRRKMKVAYEEEKEEKEDEFIFCDICNEAKHRGCKIHPVIFDHGFNFDIGPSKAGKDAGDGVFNNGILPIPQGVMFGKYGGKFYDVKGYNKMKKLGGESGNAWALRDRDLNRIIGYVDPGWKPNVNTNWMAYVNCASKKFYQNLWPGQYTDETGPAIYYRSTRPIHFGEELLTFYGNSYARDLQIKVNQMELYEGIEDWTERGVVCQYCHTGFTFEEDLKKHMESTSSAANAGCKVLRSELNKADVAAGELPFVCDECGKGFASWKKLKGHENNHRKRRPCPSVCQHCGKTSPNVKALQSHIRNQHVLKRDHDCPMCDKSFVSQSDLNQHKKQAHIKEKIFKCPQCGRKFAVKAKMDQHISVVHNRVMPYKCPECGKRFAAAGNMRSHIKAIHTKEKNWICEDCNDAFVTSSELHKHRICRHTFEYPHFCLVCDKGFIQKRDMMEHIRRLHPDDFERNEQILERQKPAVCSKCKKRFKTDEEVQIHKEKMHS